MRKHGTAFRRVWGFPAAALVFLTLCGLAFGAAGTPGGRAPVFLTSDRPGDQETIALEYARENAGMVRGAAIRQPIRITSRASKPAGPESDLAMLSSILSRHNRTRHVHLMQRVGGIEIVGAHLGVHVDRAGRVITMGDRTIDGAPGRVTAPAPLLDAVSALQGVSDSLGYTWDGSVAQVGDVRGEERRQALTAGTLARESIPARLVYFPFDGRLRLAWEFMVHMPRKPEWWMLCVDALNGQVLRKENLYRNASYRVYALPYMSPDDGPHTIAVNPSDPAASPFGWHDADGVAGAEYTDTRGNNVFAQEDTNGDDAGGLRPNGTAVLSFDFGVNLSAQPNMYQSAAIVNLFYWNNLCHDIFYRYGFDEAGGNFQLNNYGNGGAGGDPVYADAQDGSGRSNANFATPPDGQPGRMQMYLFDMTNPMRDGDLDNAIIVHEYGHGLSTRLVAGPNVVDGLWGMQSGGMGEGWSDWVSLVFTAKPEDTGTEPRGVGMYVLGEPLEGAGIRRYPYSTSMAVNPWTYGSLVTLGGEVHDVGEIWCAVLWDLYWNLVDEYGFDPDLYAGTGGNNIAMQLVLDGMKLTPHSPTFLEGRDAILLADRNTYGGQNQGFIWRAFAKRGMGLSAYDGGHHNSSLVVEAFDFPSEGQIILDRGAYRSDGAAVVQVEDFYRMGPSVAVTVNRYGAGYLSPSNTGPVLASVVINLARVRGGQYATTVPVASLGAPAHGNTLRFAYASALTGRARYAAVPVDNVPPVISNVRLASFGADRATIEWETDEPANSYARAVTNLPPAGPWSGSETYAGLGSTNRPVTHSVELLGLAPLHTYYASVMSADQAGNTNSRPADPSSTAPADYLVFGTLWVNYAFKDDMERGPSRWATYGKANSWELGRPVYGVTRSHSPTNCWATDLDGDYDNVMNAWLVTEPIHARKAPELRFWHWYHFAPYFDYGAVEINNGHGWMPLTGTTPFQGASDGWREEVYRLDDYANTTFQVRFRLETDPQSVGAGWYIDDVSVAEIVDPGVWALEVIRPVDDSRAYSAANDGDGWPEVGETFKVRIRAVNADRRRWPDVTATVESPNEGVTLLGANHLTYGSLGIGQTAESAEWLTFRATSDPKVLENQIPLFHSAVSSAGGRWEDTVLLEIARWEGISGTVSNSLGQRLAGVTVKAAAPGEPTVVARTGADGRYAMEGLRFGVEYAVTASLVGQYLDSGAARVQAPASGVDFRLLRSFVRLAPPAIDVRVKLGGSTNVTVTLANTNALIRSDADAAVRFAPEWEWDPARVHLAVPAVDEDVVLRPGAVTALVFAASAESSAEPGYYPGAVALDGTYVSTGPTSIPVIVRVEGESVSGWVRDVAGTGVANIIVSALAGARGLSDRETRTDANGFYSFSSLVGGREYTVHATLTGYSPADPVRVTAPASNVNFTIGRADAVFSTNYVDMVVAPGGRTNKLFRILNSNAVDVLRRVDINLKLSLEVQFATEELAMTLSTGTNDIVVPPRGTRTIGLQLVADNVQSGSVHFGHIVAYGNHILRRARVLSEVRRIPMRVRVVGPNVPAMSLGGVSVADDSGDGFLAPGEGANLTVLAENQGFGDARMVTGAISSLAPPSALTVVDPDVVFPTNIPSRMFADSVDTARIVVGAGVAEGSNIPMRVIFAGAGARRWTNGFVLAVRAAPGLVVSPTNLHAQVREGETATARLSLSNRSSYVRNVMLDIDFQDRPASLAGASAAAAVRPPAPVDWSALDMARVAGDSLLIEVAPGMSDADLARLCGQRGLTLVRRYALIPYAHVRVAPGTALATAASALAGVPGIVRVEPDGLARVSEILPNPKIFPNDPYFSSLWGLHNTGQTGGSPGADMDAPEAWAVSTGGVAVVAVLDTGIDYLHPDLRDNMWVNVGETGVDSLGRSRRANGEDDDGNGLVDDVYGYNFADGTNDPMDDHVYGGHGSHVSGTIGAVGNNGIGVVGVNWKARLMAVKIADLYGGIQQSTALAGTEYAIRMGAKVINNSWGGLVYSHAMYNMIEVARVSNVLVVCAAGNDGTDNDGYPSYPASYANANILAVAATDSDNRIKKKDPDNPRDWGSNWGASSVDIAAPGVDIWSCYTTYYGGSLYGSMSGTSMATPHASGVAALIRSVQPDVSWEDIKRAMLATAAKEDALYGVVKSGGHVSAYRAIAAAQRRWLDVEPLSFRLAPGQSTNMTVYFNRDRSAPYGTYRAAIGANYPFLPAEKVKVTMVVSPFPVARFDAYRVDDSVLGDMDGLAEPGETIDLFVSIHNDGNTHMTACTGVLTTTNAGVTVTQGLYWPLVGIGDATESTVPARIALGPSRPRNIDFRLRVNQTGGSSWTNLAFRLPVGVYGAVTGRVVDAISGDGIALTDVHYYGTGAGSTLTDAGGFYRIDGLSAGEVVVRAVPTNRYCRSAWATAVVGGGSTPLTLPVGMQAVTMTPPSITTAVLSAWTTNFGVKVENLTPYAWESEVYEIKGTRVLLLCDGAHLSGLQDIVRSLGVDCDLKEENQLMGYSSQIDTFLPYDIVIADLTGTDGYGRKLSDVENQNLELAVWSGVKLIVTGRTPLNTPYNGRLRALLGDTGAGRSTDLPQTGHAVDAADPALAGPFCTVRSNHTVRITQLNYDIVEPSTNDGARVVMRAGDRDVKIMRRRFGSGEAVLWSGNPSASEWRTPGVLQDVFKNLLFGYAAGDVSWMNVAAVGPFRVGAAATNGFNVRLTATDVWRREIEPLRAGILFRSNLAGVPDRAMKVDFVIWPVAVRFKATEAVVDWLNRPLKGDGSKSSALVQLLSAGADGVIAPPLSDGSAGGDDTLLVTVVYRIPFARMGDGMERFPDFGRFSEWFSTRDFARGSKAYARAWDASTVDDSVAYGNSGLYTLRHVPGETHDFGGWTVNIPVEYPRPRGTLLDDHDGDSIPDGWSVLYGEDARNTVGPLPVSWSTVTRFDTGFLSPAQILVYSNFVFIVDTGNHRVLVTDRSLTNTLFSIGGLGTANGKFNRPQGAEFDPVRRELLVADTENNRVVVLGFNPAGPSLAYVRTVGGYGVLNGQLVRPHDVSVFPLTGDIYVADTYNNRVQRFRRDGTWVLTFGSEHLVRPMGITVDPYGKLYVCDTMNHRIICYTTMGAERFRFGTVGTADGQFQQPRDIRFGLSDRIYVTDSVNRRLQIFDAEGAPERMPQHIGSYFEMSTLVGPLNTPCGMSPALDDNIVYVADTFNNRVLQQRVLLDTDRDGMDDVWEDLNGLNRKDPSDAYGDLDGDRVINVGEYRLRTNPRNADSNGNGASDGLELSQGYHPLNSGMEVLVIRSMDARRGVIGWNATAGSVYQVQRTTDLVGVPWAVRATVTAAVDSVVGWTDPTPPVTRAAMYRVVRLDP